MKSIVGMVFLGLGAVTIGACGSGSGVDWREVNAWGEASSLGEEAAYCSVLAEACDYNCTGDYENTECDGYLSGKFDNVMVPPGATCYLENSLLTGNLIVQENATAMLQGSVFVCGDLQGDKAAAVAAGSGEEARTHVCGNLQMVAVQEASTNRTIVLKNAEFKKSGYVTVDATRVCADAQLVENYDVSVGAAQEVVVEKNCSADENYSADFAGITVWGDNAGCANY